VIAHNTEQHFGRRYTQKIAYYPRG